jgi:hypothetical protein
MEKEIFLRLWSRAPRIVISAMLRSYHKERGEINHEKHETHERKS